MECLLCRQVFSETERFLNIILMAKDSDGVCSTCQNSFEKIGDSHCPICFRKGEIRTCLDCHEWKKQDHQVQHEALFTYNAFMRDYFSKYKFQGDMVLSQVLAKPIKNHLKYYKDYTLVPVPLSPERLRDRQFNQVTAFLDSAGLSYQDILEKTDVQKQSDKNRHERLKSQNPFTIKSQKSLPERVLIVDDIYTTGATLKGIYDLLHQAGVKNVKSFSIAR